MTAGLTSHQRRVESDCTRGTCIANNAHTPPAPPLLCNSVRDMNPTFFVDRQHPLRAEERSARRARKAYCSARCPRAARAAPASPRGGPHLTRKQPAVVLRRDEPKWLPQPVCQHAAHGIAYLRSVHSHPASLHALSTACTQKMCQFPCPPEKPVAGDGHPFLRP